MLEALAPEHAERFRRGIGVAMVLLAILLALFALRYADLPWWQRLGICGMGLVAQSLAWVASMITSLRPRIPTIQTALGFVLIGCVACAAAYTGGFDAPIISMAFAVWIFGALVAPIASRVVPLLFAVQLVEVLALVYWLSPHAGPVGLFITIAIVVASFCSVGSFLHDQARIRVFLANERLEAMNAELEQRVRDQVREIIVRAREVDALNAELRQSVQQRSRELAEALRRLSTARVESAYLETGALVGGRVRIIRLLGRGGMGVVYLGDDRVTGLRVAVKLMHPSVAGDPAALQRFLVEATAASAVPHPGIVKTLQVDVDDAGRLYQIMEHVPGVSLERRLERGRMVQAHVARIGAQVARALSAAHVAGVVHRDIKPGNLIVCSGAPGVRIVDFGLSKIVADEGTGPTALTRTNQMIGTPAYMSPEQVRDAASVTAATDVYSLAIVLFELLSGARPFGETSGAGLYAAHLSADPRPLGPDTDPELAALIRTCLAKAAETRPSANQMALALEQVADRLGAPPPEEVGQHECASMEEVTVREASATPPP